MSETDILIGLATVVVCGVAAQWLATLLHVPSVLLLLAAGFLAGSVTDLVDPDELFGDLLFPGVSLAVGILLFDGGLQLCVRRVRGWRGVIAKLVSIGVLITWVIASVTISVVTDLEGTTAWLAGAILVVSGPTVVIPILRRTRPAAPSGEILEWEGILIDPIGAMLGVVMLGVVVEGDGALAAVGSIAVTLGVGTLAGLAAAAVAVGALSHASLPPTLRAPVALAAAVAAYTVSNLIATEAGLLATTVAGIALANQRRVDVDDVAAFEEGVGALMLGSLFVVLGARVSPSELGDMIGPGLILLAVLVIVARPLGVLASAVGSGLDPASQTFMAGLAPRGIVAAATASVFALELESEGHAGSDVLVPLTFVVIVGAGLIYGLGAGPLARRLRLVDSG